MQERQQYIGGGTTTTTSSSSSSSRRRKIMAETRVDEAVGSRQHAAAKAQPAAAPQLAALSSRMPE
jgi:hypothetical protein